jgi:hypothetical protein
MSRAAGGVFQTQSYAAAMEALLSRCKVLHGDNGRYTPFSKPQPRGIDSMSFGRGRALALGTWRA